MNKMKKNKLQIGIPCGKNSGEYIKFLLTTIRQTISQKTDYEIILGINDDSVDINNIVSEFSNENFKIIMCVDNNAYSFGHASCVQSIFENMSEEYGMLIDCDVAILKKNWDQILIAQLDKNNVIIGSEYDGNKYMKFPNIVFCMFKTRILSNLNISFMPAGKNKTINNDIESDIFGREVGDTIFLDTGWELPVKVKKAGYAGIPMNLESPRKDIENCIFMKPGDRGEEYHLSGEPICTHVGRSFTRSFNDPIVVRWKKRVNDYLENLN